MFFFSVFPLLLIFPTHPLGERGEKGEDNGIVLLQLGGLCRGVFVAIGSDGRG